MIFLNFSSPNFDGILVGKACQLSNCLILLSNIYSLIISSTQFYDFLKKKFQVQQNDMIGCMLLFRINTFMLNLK